MSDFDNVEKRDINQQYQNLFFSQIWIISLTWSCESRQRDTTSNGWKFQLNNLAVKELMCKRVVNREPDRRESQIK